MAAARGLPVRAFRRESGGAANSARGSIGLPRRSAPPGPSTRNGGCKSSSIATGQWNLWRVVSGASASAGNTPESAIFLRRPRASCSTSCGGICGAEGRLTQPASAAPAVSTIPSQRPRIAGSIGLPSRVLPPDSSTSFAQSGMGERGVSATGAPSIKVSICSGGSEKCNPPLASMPHQPGIPAASAMVAATAPKPASSGTQWRESRSCSAWAAPA